MIAKFSLALALCAGACAAAAQDYPTREIRSICNFAAGSGADIIVRYYSDRLSKLAGRPVLVENKPGVQGTLGKRLRVADATGSLVIQPRRGEATAR